MKYLGLFPDVPDLQGCSDGGCVFRPPTGMHTNGGCACMKRGADPMLLQLNLRRVSKHMESMRAERDALANDNAALRALLAECIPHVNGNTGEWRILRKRGFLSPEAYVIANERIEEGDALLARIVAAVKS